MHPIEKRFIGDSYEHVLTPTAEEQSILILQGKCPHNKGWNYDGHSHNDSAYKCRLCGELKFY